MSMTFRTRLTRILMMVGLACAAASAQSEPIRPLNTVNAWAQYTDRIIVRLKDERTPDKRQPMGAERARALSASAGTYLIPYRLTGGQAHVMRLTHAMPLAEVERITAKLAQDPNVLYAEPDRRKFPHLVPSDPRYNQQWNLFEAAGGINAQTAWDLTTGSPSVVVAIVDSGVIFQNPDIAGRTLPGYDMIGSDDGNTANRSGGDGGTQFFTANDGSGRDNDPSDPGDWINQNDKNGFFTDPSCTLSDSSWHGTSVASIFGAAANNGFGIAGVDWNAKILPVRVLGKCGGYTSDIMDGARWAAGIAVIGAGNVLVINPNPAQVINLSLGGPGTSCSSFEQTAINDILATGRVKAIVTSAGNESQDASQNSPGNCNGVINVAATDRNGSKASYSDFGTAITISAPGGFINRNDPADTGVNGLISTSNCGTTVPIFAAQNCPDPTDITRQGAPYIAFFASGTSFAAPQVAGAVSLMLSANPALTATDVRTILTSTARAFQVGSNCSTSFQCGAGILDVNAAARRAAAMPGGIGFTPAPPPSSGGGGGGGCTTGGGASDFALPLLMLAALLGLARRRRKCPVPQIVFINSSCGS